MRLAVIKEPDPLETRVALTPATLSKYQRLDIEVFIEKGAGIKAGFQDKDYLDAGAQVCDEHTALTQAQGLICLSAPKDEALKQLEKGAWLITMSQKKQENERLAAYNARNLTSFTLELIPRISRAQSMDCLSSQSNLSGYRAVLEAISHFNSVVPMMMTAAGMIRPAKVLILGAGVAGLQAIATAKRMGAEVFAFDVRKAAREQVESLAAQFMEVADEEDAETAGGYAKEMSKEYQQRQQVLINEKAAECDIIISTALIPNKPAPILITRETVDAMKPGSIIVDLATSTGGNCELSQADKVITHDGKTLIGYTALSRHLAKTASELYANNCFNFIELMHQNEDKKFHINLDDEIIRETLITYQGKTVHPLFCKETNNA